MQAKILFIFSSITYNNDNILLNSDKLRTTSYRNFVEIELATEIDFTNGALITGVTETGWPGAWLAGTIIFKS